jgi:hypothetical protein
LWFNKQYAIQKSIQEMTGMRNKKTFSLSNSDMESGSDRRPLHWDTLPTHYRLLNPTDRVLIHLLVEKQCRRSDLAALLGISESSLSYRIARLTKTLALKSTSLSLRPPYPDLEKHKIARMACLNNHSVRHIARHTGLSLYRVRKIISSHKALSE